MTPLLTHWNYVFLALTHRYHDLRCFEIPLERFVPNEHILYDNLSNTSRQWFNSLRLMNVLSASCAKMFKYTNSFQKRLQKRSSYFTLVLAMQHMNGRAPIHHYNDVIMSLMAYLIISLTIVYPSINSVTDQRKHQSSATLAFGQGIHRWPVNFQHKWPVTREIFPFDNVIILPTWINSNRSMDK